VQRPAQFTVTLVAEPGVDGIKSFRALLKVALRRFGLRAIDARELHTAREPPDEPQPGSFGLALERLLAGLETLGMKRAEALKIVNEVALDSVPPLRRRAYDCVYRYHNLKTSDIADDLGLPTPTARRLLEDLEAHGLVNSSSQGAGKADLWNRSTWEADEENAR
jgi:DNA-directed RNA polymerase specialized sigma24 family protein